MLQCNSGPILLVLVWCKHGLVWWEWVTLDDPQEGEVEIAAGTEQERQRAEI